MRPRKGFTLFEVLVALGVFSLILVMSANLIKYATARLHSVRSNALNDTVRNSFDFISHKIYNANTKVTGSDKTVYGFTAYNPSTKQVISNSGNNPIILIVYSSDSGDELCTYFSRNPDKQTIVMAQTNCEGDLFIDRSALTGNLTSDQVEITKFEITKSSFVNPGNPEGTTEIPYLKLNVESMEKGNPVNTAQFTASFTMDYENLNYMLKN